MSTILFYTPFDRRSRDTETLMIAFRQQGHRVMFLSQETGFQIGPFLESRGIEVFTHVLSDRRPGWWYYLRHIFFFVKFCRKHKIDIVYSHLEPANLVASVGQYFIRAQTYLCRHHINEAALSGFAKSLYYRMTYFLARKIIV
ncbi:MAG TPA: glycosyltransferase, partial [Cyclobacteriaceae bacterium]|nr:glycosyltransferase [Cyclobacteriaceae bacterium]